MRYFKTIITAITLSLGLVGCGESDVPSQKEVSKAPSQDQKTSSQHPVTGPAKIGFIYVSPIGGAGYTYQHDLARKAIEDRFGDKVIVKYVENVAEGPDAENVILDFAKQDYKAVFATSFGYMTPMSKVAKRYPKIAFEHASGFKRSVNMNTYLARFYEGRYLTGLVAGEMTKTNIIGYVAAFPIPEVVRGINAFTRGVRAVNPQALVHVTWTDSWFDPETERGKANALINQGADVLTLHADSPATIQAAEAAGIYAIGYNSDLSKFGAKAHLTACVTNWAPYYLKRVEEILSGRWQGNQGSWYGLKENMVQLAPFNQAVPKAVQDKVMQAKAAIIAGSVHPFKGPVVDNEGLVRIAAGTTMTDKEMLSFNWYVEGVVGKLPY